MLELLIGTNGALWQDSLVVVMYLKPLLTILLLLQTKLKLRGVFMLIDSNTIVKIDWPMINVVLLLGHISLAMLNFHPDYNHGSRTTDNLELNTQNFRLTKVQLNIRKIAGCQMLCTKQVHQFIGNLHLACGNNKFAVLVEPASTRNNMVLLVHPLTIRFQKIR